MQLHKNIPLAPLTNFRVGGPARCYCQPENSADFKTALDFAASHDLPWFVLGGGSNLLISDRGYPGLIIHTGKLEHISIREKYLKVGSGLSVISLTREAARTGLSGLEFSGGLPGSVGGAVYMNARCYGKSFADIVESVEALSPANEHKVYSRDELAYAYKHSIFMETGAIILAATLRLSPGQPEKIANETRINHTKRAQMGQYLFPNAGCIFKNNYDVGIPSGRLIDEAGLRGLRVGDAEVFEQHANFIVNRGQASAADIRKLIEQVKQRVFEERGIRIEEEVKYLGFEEDA